MNRWHVFGSRFTRNPVEWTNRAVRRTNGYVFVPWIAEPESYMAPALVISVTLVCAIAAAVAVIGEFRRDDQEP